MADLGIPPLEEFPAGSDAAVSWICLSRSIIINAPELLPKTIELLFELANKDVSLFRSYKEVTPQERLTLYKEYLKNEVIPFCCGGTKKVIEQADLAESIEHLRRLLPGIFLESALHLLAHAEAEYLLTYCLDHSSMLAKCIPTGNDIDTSPTKLFFTLWMKNLNLERKGIIEELLGHYGESGLSENEDVSDGKESISRAALEKQIYRFLYEGKTPPSLATVEKWAKGLYWHATEIQGRAEGHDHYSEFVRDTYCGVLILDRLFKEMHGRLDQKDLMQIMKSYQNRFDQHMSAMKKEANKMSASTPK
jgi:hypothetical protein